MRPATVSGPGKGRSLAGLDLAAVPPLRGTTRQNTTRRRKNHAEYAESAEFAEKSGPLRKGGPYKSKNRAEGGVENKNGRSPRPAIFILGRGSRTTWCFCFWERLFAAWPRESLRWVELAPHV